MGKMKTHRGAAKRLKRTGTGKLRHAKASKRHLLTNKSRAHKRRLGKSAEVGPANIRHAERLVPYI